MDALTKRTVWIIVGVAVVVFGVAGVVSWEYHKQPQFCATCHIMEPYLETWRELNYGAYAHAEYDVACLDCHEPTLEQQVNELVVFVSGDFSDPLERRTYEMEFCLECHMENEHASYEDIIARTSDYVVGDQEINPHDPHAGLEDIAEYMPVDAQFQCHRCHRAHEESPLVEYCYSCHHERVFESCRHCH